MSFLRRRWIPLALLLALAAGLWIGWVVLRRAVVEWVTSEHRVGDWIVRPHGGRILSLESIQADSIQVIGPGVRLVARQLKLSWFRHLGTPVHRFPFLLSLEVERIGVDLVPAPPRRSSRGPVRFPSSLRLPVALGVRLGSLDVRRDSTLRLHLGGLEASTSGPSAARISWQDLRSQGIDAALAGSAGLDWGLDSLRGDLGILASSGCCARDSATLSISAPFDDLATGRARLDVSVEALGHWSAVLPGLAKAPVVEDVRLHVEASRTSGRGPVVDARLAFRCDTVLFAPALAWDVRAKTDSVGTEVVLAARGEDGARLDLSLSALGDLDSAVRFDRFRGKATVAGMGYFLAGQPHPFDGDIEVGALGLNKGRAVVRLASGSVVEGGATWKGLHWDFVADIAPEEPWAVGWGPGLALPLGGRASGRDTVGAAIFEAVAYGPRYRFVEADSLRVSARLDLHEIRFPRIGLFHGGDSWSGDGHVGWTSPGYAFGLAPDSGTGNARVEGDFLGRVLVDVRDFPATGLPFSDTTWRAPFPLRVSAIFERTAPTKRDSARMSLSAHLQAKPAGDSLQIRVEAAMEGDHAKVSALRLDLGEGSLEGTLEAFRDDSTWRLSSVRTGFREVLLEKLVPLWPGLPRVRGRLDGAVAMSRDSGVSGDLRLGGFALQGEKGDWTVLPDLVAWGAQDTLNVAGRWPVAGMQDPFRLTLDGLFEKDVRFSLLAFHGDIVRVKATGVVEDRTRLKATLRAEGGIQIPGTEARLDQILVDGRIEGSRTPKGISWNAWLEGDQGVLRAIKGQPLTTKFRVRAEPGTIFLDSLSLRGKDAGMIDLQGRYSLASGLFVGEGKARDFRLDLGDGKRFRLGSMDLVAGDDQRLRAKLSDVSWEQTWGRKGDLWVEVDRAQLTLVQAKDWRKLQGQIQVSKLLYTRELADPVSLIRSAGNAISGTNRPAAQHQKEGIPLLLDLRVWGGGDSVRVSNNLAKASLTFDLQATGPSDAMLLNGTLDADPEGAHFGYLGKQFALEEFHAEWNSTPPLNGRYALVGTRSILQTCPEALEEQERTTNVSALSSGSCNLNLSSEGTLAEPRLRPLTSDCGAGGADEGAVQAALALARDCYPQETGQGTASLGGAARSTIVDLGVQQSVSFVNDAIRKQLREQREDGRVFLPDSIALTDVPIGGSRDQLGLMALYRLSDHIDAEGEYRHTFAQSASTSNAANALSDDYSLRLRWRPPLAWIEERRIQERLRDHLVFQVELGQSLDERSQRETTIRPSIRYRWEFW